MIISLFSRLRMKIIDIMTAGNNVYGQYNLYYPLGKKYGSDLSITKKKSDFATD